MATKYTYSKEIKNTYLKEIKIIKDYNKIGLDVKCKDQIEKWDIKEEKQRNKEFKKIQKDKALKMTCELNKEIDYYENILKYRLENKIIFNWHDKINNEEYSVFEEKKYTKIEEEIKELETLKVKLEKTRIFEWLFEAIKLDRENKLNNIIYKLNCIADEIQQDKYEYYNQYLIHRKIFYENKQKKNQEILEFKYGYESRNEKYVEKYIYDILKELSKNYKFKNKIDIGYCDGCLVVDFRLPYIEEIPNICKYTLGKDGKEIIPIKMAKRVLDELYKSVVYQIALRTIYEIFDVDYNNSIDNITFNGYVDFINPATGNDTISNIISIPVNSNVFKGINLNRVNDYESCIKDELGGSTYSKITTFKHFKPCNTIKNIKNRQNQIEYKNLLEMDSIEVEILVGKLYEDIYSEKGYIIEVTKPSKDGGVDIFMINVNDKSKKYIIQIKRYKNPIEVSYLRELNGIIEDNKASNAVFVTTSRYTRGCVEFVEDKPIELIDGDMLVSMLNENGYTNYSIM